MDTRKPVNRPADQQKTATPTGTVSRVAAGTGVQKTPGMRKILVGVIGLVVLAAVLWFAVLPLLSGTAGTGSPAVIPQLPAPTPVPPALPATPAVTSSLSFDPAPTQVPPAAMVVTFQAERDPITGLVTVTFTGGARYAVKDVVIRLTRSDGIVETKTVTLSEIGPIATLQGTKTGDDRIEVTARYFNGEEYRIVDRILEYKKRDW